MESENKVISIDFTLISLRDQHKYAKYIDSGSDLNYLPLDLKAMTYLWKPSPEYSLLLSVGMVDEHFTE